MENQPIVETQEGSTEESKTFTEAEVQELLQKESDRRVTEALKKYEAKTRHKIDEATKLATMNEQEKFQYELEKREQELLTKEKELTLANNKITASNILAEKGIPVSFIDLVLDTDAEVMNSRIGKLTEEFQAAVQAQVSRQLAGSTPKAISNVGVGVKSASEYTALEATQLYRDNPTLYKQIFG